MSWLRLVLLSLWLSLVWSTMAMAQFLPLETIEIPSVRFTDSEFLTGAAASGTPVKLSATLKLPEGAGPHPVVLLLHGSDGVESSAVNGWRNALSGMGYATLRLDSFGGRGIKQISTDQAAVSQFSQIYDSYRVVEVLGADPRIAADRFVVMGFSRGGTAALYGSLARFHELYGPASGTIAAYLPFYAACNFELTRGLETVAAPIREFHGADDDWTSAAVCQTYIERLKAAGADVEMTVYEGARHAFDASLAYLPFRANDAQRSFDCMRIEGEGGVLLNRDTGKPFSYADACVTLGPTVKYDKAATEAAIATVKTLLTTTVGAP